MSTLRDVEGQGRALEGLRRALARHRLHHAYLFAGPDGVGKGLSAWGLAAALLCVQPREDGDGCGQCNACQRVAGRQHPDLHVIERLPHASGSRLETFIKIGQIRELQRSLSFKSFEGARRVVLLFEPESMNPSTANALLKTLEEPGDDTHFVLISHAAHRLLPTIISRCQRVRFVPLPRSMVASKIASISGVDATTAALLAGLSEGSIGKGLVLAGSPLLEQRATLLERIDSPEALRNIGALSELADTLGRDKGELPLLFLLLRTWYRDLMLVGAGAPVERLVHSDLVAQAQARAGMLPFAAITARLDLVNETEQAILVGNANARLFLERLFVRLAGGGTQRAAA
jgi:DNA polymerase-3 subunit delta'